MAISFSKNLSTTNFLNAYNVNKVIFSSDNVVESEKCTIDIAGNQLEITPINNIFEYDFSSVVKVLINQNKFRDLILPNLVAGDDSSHVYDDTINTFINPEITFTITFANESTEEIKFTYKWLKSVEQLEQYKKGVVTGGNKLYILSPFRKETANTYNLTYFEGYPFDVSFLIDEPSAGLTTVLNQTNAISFDFNLDYIVNRLFFSDGRTTITIENHLPLVDGLNKLKITQNGNIIFLNLTKIPAVEGEYVKYINQYGEWNYWLFNCVHKRDNKIKDLGDYNNDFNDVQDTTDPFVNIGKISQNALTLISDDVDELNQDVLNEIFESPKVYYFTGLRLSQVTEVSWLSCKVKTAKDTITDYKKKLKKYKIVIELPRRNTMTL